MVEGMTMFDGCLACLENINYASRCLVMLRGYVTLAKGSFGHGSWVAPIIKGCSVRPMIVDVQHSQRGPISMGKCINN